MLQIRPIAIYLPQFHPIPENNIWWGRGFTEWTNVTKAKPLFKGHYQPHLPADLGFYDLRLPETRAAQAQMAKEHGIYGFCYYHYWFNGRRILDRPFQEVFETYEPDFPFMLCWANENWSRAWDGSETDILLEQNYSEEDDREHIRFLIPFFKDPRYIKVDGKPVFIIYRSIELPDVKRTLQIWRQEAKEAGLDLYLCRMERWNYGSGEEYLRDGFDAAIDFQPLSPSLKEYLKLDAETKNNFFKKIIRKCRSVYNSKILHKSKPMYIDFTKFVRYDLSRSPVSYKQFPGVSPMWDNSARKKNKAVIFLNSSPQLFGKWLTGKINKFKPFSKEENFIFINAWNEWAEGNHLEPCQKWGTRFLEEIKKAVEPLQNNY